MPEQKTEGLSPKNRASVERSMKHIDLTWAQAELLRLDDALQAANDAREKIERERDEHKAVLDNIRTAWRNQHNELTAAQRKVKRVPHISRSGVAFWEKLLETPELQSMNQNHEAKRCAAQGGACLFTEPDEKAAHVADAEATAPYRIDPLELEEEFYRKGDEAGVERQHWLEQEAIDNASNVLLIGAPDLASDLSESVSEPATQDVGSGKPGGRGQEPSPSRCSNCEGELCRAQIGEAARQYEQEKSWSQRFFFLPPWCHIHQEPRKHGPHHADKQGTSANDACREVCWNCKKPIELDRMTQEGYVHLGGLSPASVPGQENACQRVVCPRIWQDGHPTMCECNGVGWWENRRDPKKYMHRDSAICICGNSIQRHYPEAMWRHIAGDPACNGWERNYRRHDDPKPEYRAADDPDATGREVCIEAQNETGPANGQAYETQEGE